MPAEPRRVWAVGYFGMGNFGDDLFARTARTAGLWPDATVRTLTPDGVGPWSRLDPLGQAWRAAATLAGLAWADTVALCGGSVLERLSGTARLRERLRGRRRVEALGVSVGPFAGPGDAAAVAAALASYDRVVVRDQASVARLAELGHRGEVVVGGDLAAVSDLVRPAGRGDRVVVCPSAAAGVAAGDRLRRLRPALAAVGDPPVTVLCLNRHPRLGDAAAGASLAAALRADGIDAEAARYTDLAGAVQVLAVARAVWSERLHGALVAYLAGVPVAMLAHHAKLADLAVDIGLADALLVAPGTPWTDAARATFAAGPHWDLTPDAYRARAARTYLPAD